MMDAFAPGATMRKAQTKTGPDCSGFTAEQPANDAIRSLLVGRDKHSNLPQ